MSRLLKYLRPEQEAIWKQFAHELSGQFVPKKGWRGQHAVIVKHANWTLILDTERRPKRATKTRLRAPYVNRDDFYFRLYRRQALSGLRKVAGMQDIEVGDTDFDREFIIQSNDERKVRMLLHHTRIRQMIAWQPEISLFNNPDANWVVDDWREGVSELAFEVRGLITDLDRLHDLYDLFAELLNHLCHIGSAYEDDPLL